MSHFKLCVKVRITRLPPQKCRGHTLPRLYKAEVRERGIPYEFAYGYSPSGARRALRKRLKPLVDSLMF